MAHPPAHHLHLETCQAWNPGIKGRSCSNSGVSRKRHLPAAPRHMEPQHPQSSHGTKRRNCNFMWLDLPKRLHASSKKTNLIESIVWTYCYSSLTTQLRVYVGGWHDCFKQKKGPRDCAEDSWLIPDNLTQYDTIIGWNYWIIYLIYILYIYTL